MSGQTETPKAIGWSDRINATIDAGRGLSGTSLINMVLGAVEVLVDEAGIPEDRRTGLESLKEVLLDRDNRLRVAYPDSAERQRARELTS